MISIIRDFTSSSDTNKDCVELVEAERVGLLVVNTWSMVPPLHMPAPPPATASLSFKRLLEEGPSMMWFLAPAAICEPDKESGNTSEGQILAQAACIFQKSAGAQNHIIDGPTCLRSRPSP